VIYARDSSHRDLICNEDPYFVIIHSMVSEREECVSNELIWIGELCFTERIEF